MEMFTDLKFEGDLAFLNENLEGAINAFNNKKNDDVNEEPSLKLEMLMLRKKLENDENFHNNQFSQSSINVQSTADIKFERSLHNTDSFQKSGGFKDSENIHNWNNLGQSEIVENAINFQNVRNFQNAENLQNLNNTQFLNNANSVRNSENLQNLNNGNNLQNIENVNNLQNAANLKYMQNASIIQNTGNNNYAVASEKYSEIKANQRAYSDIRIEKNTIFKSYQEKVVEVAQPTISKTKSQLELMLISSGYDMEVINNFKMELLDLEKDKIIMKYKLDLMMLILKS